MLAKFRLWDTTSNNRISSTNKLQGKIKRIERNYKSKETQTTNGNV